MSVTPSGKGGRYNYNYIYQYKDHLGNVRLDYTQGELVLGQPVTLMVLEENHYYPFGMKHKGYNTSQYGFVPVTNGNSYYVNLEQLPPDSVSLYKYKYNGKEYQDELGLNMYDYGARNYDPALGRWMNIDPLAEKSRRFNPYTYALNNPVYFIDPDGMEADDTLGGIEKLKDDWFTQYIESKKTREEKGINYIAGPADGGPGDPPPGPTSGPNCVPTPLDEVIVTRDPYKGTYFDRNNKGSGEYGWNDGSAQKLWNEYMPLTSSFHTFYIGTKTGDGSEMAWGAGLLLLDLATIGEGSLLFKGGKGGVTVIGETMLRVETAASKIPGAKILNDMPEFIGSKHQITSQMMEYNRKWILQQMRSGRSILDIGQDLNRVKPSIFYQMEQNMLKNYQKLHPGSLNIIKP